MRKNVVKLNESQLKKIVTESVKKVLKEIQFNYDPRYEILVDGVVEYENVAKEDIQYYVMCLMSDGCLSDQIEVNRIS